MNKYAGMCVGGPMAGKFLAAEMPHFRVAESERLEYWVLGESKPRNPSFNYKKYEWCEAVDKNQNLWLYDGMTTTQAMEQIYEAYSKSNSQSR